MEAFNVPSLGESSRGDESRTIGRSPAHSSSLMLMNSGPLSHVVTLGQPPDRRAHLPRNQGDTFRWQAPVNDSADALATSNVDGVDYPKLLPTGGPVGDKVHGPEVVRTECRGRQNPQMSPALFELPVPKTKLFLLEDLVHCVFRHSDALVPQRNGQSPVAVPRPCPCCLN